ncbi:MAG: TRC40/GET3/ArsA family transport-energizing ATPase [Chloroflexi bacterium]|nr:TRC40/GET3/ArsA family transport-energizing ATPase [Chloroflexota bacterium]
MRIILYTGKGGVGKTSVAAATAVRAAEMGYRTIVMSTDPAHSLGDSLDIPLSSQPKAVAENLWAQEVDVLHELGTHWRTIQKWMTALLAWRGLDEVIAEEMAVLPGMEEMASLLYIVQHNDSGSYDVAIVDCAPTGETLRLLSFPEVLRWWMERIFPLERMTASVVRPIVKTFFNVPVPSDEVFASIKSLFAEIERMRGILIDGQSSSMRLVVNPEKMVVKEAQRTYTYLNLYGYSTDLIVCNRMLPVGLKDHYFDSWKETQERNLKIIEEGFTPIPIRTVPLLDQEVVGFPMLRRMGEAIFGEEDPTQTYFVGQAREITKENGRFALTLNLPFTSKEEVSLVQAGDELIVHVGNQKRNIILPRMLAELKTQEARLEDGRLRIIFGEEKK